MFKCIQWLCFCCFNLILGTLWHNEQQTLMFIVVCISAAKHDAAKFCQFSGKPFCKCSWWWAALTPVVLLYLLRRFLKEKSFAKTHRLYFRIFFLHVSKAKHASGFRFCFFFKPKRKTTGFQSIYLCEGVQCSHLETPVIVTQLHGPQCNATKKAFFFCRHRPLSLTFNPHVYYFAVSAVHVCFIFPAEFPPPL